jgi:hypothetical protein
VISDGGRCINTLATRISNSPDAGWASVLSGSADAYGFACMGAGHAPEMYGTGRELPDEQQTKEVLI